MVGVVVSNEENIDKALRKFKKKCERAGVLKEVKERAAYLKPSVRKKMDKSRAIRRQRNATMEINM